MFLGAGWGEVGVAVVQRSTNSCKRLLTGPFLLNPSLWYHFWPCRFFGTQFESVPTIKMDTEKYSAGLS